MLVKQVSVFLENQAGRLAEVASVLADNQINIGALSMADTTDFGILRFIVDAPDDTIKVLKENGFTASTTNVIAVTVSDRPGGLAQVLKVLDEAKIGVEYAYAFVEKGQGEAKIILRVEDNEKAMAVLREHNLA
ncbi:MAG: ACT domain-containing protein [Hyphomonadaceae bacterium]|nr:ACT domain-containing protein [Clostridia bacterium]